MGYSLNFLDHGNIFTPLEFIYSEQILQQNSCPYTFVSGRLLMKHKPQCKSLFYLFEI